MSWRQQLIRIAAVRLGFGRHVVAVGAAKSREFRKVELLFDASSSPLEGLANMLLSL